MCTWIASLPRWACTQVWNKVNHSLTMGGNTASDVVNGNVASKAGDVSINGRMTCGAEVSRVVWNTRVI